MNIDTEFQHLKDEIAGEFLLLKSLVNDHFDKLDAEYATTSKATRHDVTTAADLIAAANGVGDLESIARAVALYKRLGIK